MGAQVSCLTIDNVNVKCDSKYVFICVHTYQLYHSVINSFTGQDGARGGLEPFEWTHSLNLDPDGKFSIHWKPGDDQITLQLEVRAYDNEYMLYEAKRILNENYRWRLSVIWVSASLRREGCMVPTSSSLGSNRTAEQ